MATVKLIEIDTTQSIRVLGLPSNKPITAKRIAVSARGRVWLIDSKGTVRASRFGEIRCERNYGGSTKHVPLSFLQEDDIRALAAIGVIDAVAVTALQRSVFRNRFFDREMKDIAHYVESLAEADINVPKGWRKAAEAYANTRADKRMAQKFPPTTNQ